MSDIKGMPKPAALAVALAVAAKSAKVVDATRDGKRDAKRDAKHDPKVDAKTPPTAVSNPSISVFGAPRAPIGEIENDDVTPRDMLAFISAAVDHHRLVGFNIDGFNRLIDTGLPKIIMHLFRISKKIKNERTQTARDKLHTHTKLEFDFSDIKVAKPQCSTYPMSQMVDLHPSQALITGLNYDGAMTMSATVTLTASFADGRDEVKTVVIPQFEVTRFPIMKGSNRCHTANLSRAARKQMQDDPNDEGGTFCAKSQEFVIDPRENSRFNARHVHLRSMSNEHARCEFISQPGGSPFENSSQLIVRYMVNGAITIEINSTKLSKVRFPFYIIYRMLGMTSDRDIMATVVPAITGAAPLSALDAQILQALEKAMQMAGTTSDKDMFRELVNELSREKIIRVLAEKLSKILNNSAYGANDNAVQYLNDDLVNIIDRVCLPHIGLTSAERAAKRRDIGLSVRETLLTHLGVLAPTDRDHCRNKRMHGAGVSIAKIFKTQFNNMIIIPVNSAFRRELKNNQFSSLTPANIRETFRNAISPSNFNRAMTQSITSGESKMVIKGKVSTNRVSSTPLERKNQLNAISSQRSITTSSSTSAAKQTERADMMRRVHPSYTGYICVAQSADTGENVGMKKQLAITASLCEAGEPLTLEMRLEADPDVRRLADVSDLEIAERGLCRITVNGKPCGACVSGPALREKYRALRADDVIDATATIAWDPMTDRLEFRCSSWTTTSPSSTPTALSAKMAAPRRASR